MHRLFLSVSVFLGALIPQVFGQPVDNPGDFCSALRTSSVKRVSIRAKLLMTYSTIGRVDGGEAFFYSPQCNGPDAFVLADFSRLPNGNKLDRFLSHLPAEKDFVLESEISGVVETSVIPLFGHLNWARAKLEISDVYTIQNVTGSKKTVSPNYEAPAPLTELGESLRNTNSVALLWILKVRDFGFDAGAVLSDAFTLVDADGREFRKADLSGDENGPGKSWLDGGRKSVTTPDTIRIEGTTYAASGKLSVENKSFHIENYRYENTFELSNGSFSLMKSRLLREQN